MSSVGIVSIIVLIAMVVVIVAGKLFSRHLQRQVVVAEMSIAFCAIAVYTVVELDKYYDQGPDVLNTAISVIIIKVILLAGAVLASGGLLLSILKSEQDAPPADTEK